MSWFPSKRRGKAVPSTESPYSSRVSERDNRTPPFCHVAKSRPIRSFPAIKPGMASANQTFLPLSPVRSNVITPKSYKKRCACTSGVSLEVPQLVYTSDLSQSVALQLILHCSSQERRLPLRSSSHFK